MSLLIWSVGLIALAAFAHLFGPKLSSSMRWILGGLSGLVLATLIRYRALPFFPEDTMLSGGKLRSTAEVAAAAAKIFYVTSAIFLFIGLMSLFLGGAWTYGSPKAKGGSAPKT